MKYRRHAQDRGLGVRRRDSDVHGIRRVALLVVGRATRPALRPGSHLAVATGTQLPPPTSRDLVAPTRPYLIGPFDQLSVPVFGIPALSQQQVPADASGR